MQGKSTIERNLVWLAFAVAFAIKSFNYFSLSRELFNYHAHQQHVPAQVLLGQLPSVKNTVPDFFAKNILSVQPYVEAYFVKFTGYSFFDLFVYSSVLQLFIGLLGAYWMGEVLSGSPWGGFYSSVILIWGWVHYGTFGYLLDFSLGMYPGMLAIALGFLVLGLWMLDWWKSAFLALAIVFNIHLSNAFILATVLGIHAALVLISKERPKGFVRNLLIGFFIALIVSFPQLWLISKMGYASLPLELKDSWWAWMQVRKRYHVFPWREAYQVVQFLLVVLLTAVGTFVLGKKGVVQKSLLKKVYVLFGSVVALTLMNYVGVEFMESPEIAALILTRASVFLVPVAGAFIFMLAQELFQLDKRGAFLLGVAVLLANYFPSRQPKVWALLTCVILFAFFFLWKSKKLSQKGATQYSLALALKITLPLFILFGLRENVLFHQSIRSEKTSDWRSLNDLRDWAAANTKPDAIFLIPPSITCASVCLGRIPLIVSTDIGMSVYIKSAFPFEQHVLKTVFDVDVANLALGRKLKLEVSGYFDKKYDLLNTQDVLNISKEFREVKYVVTYNPQELSLPLRHKNQLYSVYELN